MPVNINWGLYPTFAVNVNINSVGTTPPLDKVEGIFIDNSNNSTFVVIVFPDTGYTIDVPALQSVFLPVFSQTNIMNIYNGGLVNAGPTNILVTNFLVQNFLSEAQQLVYPVVQATSIVASFAERFVTPVVGDNHADFVFNMNPNFTTILLTAQARGFFIITALTIAVENCYMDGSVTAPVSGNIGLRTGFLTTKLAVPLSVVQNSTYIPYTRLLDKVDLYEVYDATQNVVGFTDFIPTTGKAHFSLDYLWTVQQ